jgi:hypothetical protein
VTRRQTISTAILVVASAVPLLGLMYFANLAATRSAADLAFADQCVDWAHKDRSAQAADGPVVAATCDRYFHFRSEDNADEDDRRWADRRNRGVAGVTTAASAAH